VIVSPNPRSAVSGETEKAVTDCMEPGCGAVGDRFFVASKPGKETLRFRFCREHYMPAAMGLIKFGMYSDIEFEDRTKISEPSDV
jgi:hypothetical protein